MALVLCDPSPMVAWVTDLALLGTSFCSVASLISLIVRRRTSRAEHSEHFSVVMHDLEIMPSSATGEAVAVTIYHGLAIVADISSAQTSSTLADDHTIFFLPVNASFLAATTRHRTNMKTTDRGVLCRL